ncbi:GNAT family N-acetyltransferase [Bradymonas sediminis]|uniref:GNAT family N-acetyltransferase n=1 Tax=Bradymonas sediminis TaxID=1548548 RepID=A0A2Z4FRP5_9DELT|nr:GNAT family N-acetyltransferase [Bradymonas sediminis]AWV91394.1 GNAT family N-acetyltransferase [Bradymonas sediminis]TDP76758.1 acetyltransferase (GNAT) family protein [Bradymonas sediminis]
MNWYEKLSQYFPTQEMKTRAHMELLLKERGDIYHKDEGPYHVLMYAETPGFVFVDYIWVSAKARGQGIGHKLMAKLKQKGKPIILEVEPIDYEDSDTEKRLHFYKREDFEHASTIGYHSRSLRTQEVDTLEILYWSPGKESEESIMEKMKQTYDKIHTFKDVQLYGESHDPVDDVLSIDPEATNDILEFDEPGA